MARGEGTGSKNASRAVAARAESRTGIGADVLRKLLPIAASMVMRALARRQAAQGNGPAIDDVRGGFGRMFGGR